MNAGRLYLVPAPLDHGCAETAALAEVLPAGTIAVAARLSHWICENAKSARGLLKRVDALQALATPLQQQVMTELPRVVHKKGDHAPASFDARPLLQAALQGKDMGLLSEAGMPAVADPGSSVVRAAHELGIEVVPLVGPVSLLLTLAASGLNGQNFAFVGYLPQDSAARVQRLRELEGLALRTGQTQMFIETPYRNPAMWQALLQALKPGTRVAVASALTLPAARCRTASVADWKHQPVPVEADLPAVFALGA
jgi:16S rRNA (cytidine1402-2'-O)-methyltransferase